jgi:PEP-CTERM motif
MRMSASFGALALVLFAAAAPARADYFYNWGPSLPTVFSDNSGMHVTLSDGDQVGPVSGVQHMTATVLSTFVNAGVTGTDTFSQGQAVGLAIDLTDGTQAGHVTFDIGISGTLSAGNPSVSNLSYAFLDGTTRTMTVNGTQYGVTLDGPGTIPGSILATITPGGLPLTGGGSGGTGGTGGTGGSGGTTTSNAPEPSTLVLAALGTGLVTVICWRRFGRAVRLAVIG